MLISRAAAGLAMGFFIAGCCPVDRSKNAGPATMPAAVVPGGSADETTISLFDGKTLKNWKSSDFGGDGEVKVQDGKLIVGAGGTLSGVTWTGRELPTMDYEIELDAMKLSGDDFFLGLTFPYRKSFASLIMGGWGGGLTGISSIDGFDAANNDTSTNQDYKRNQWYHVRLKVTATKIEAWLDDKQIVDTETEGKRIDTRTDIDNAHPLGMTTYQTVAAYKNIVLKKL